MLVYNSHLDGTPVLSIQDGGRIADIVSPVIDPNNLKIIAFRINGPLTNNTNNILDSSSIREYSRLGTIVDNAEEFISADDVIKIKNVLELNFNLIGLKVETKKRSKLGHVIDFTFDADTLMIQQIIVKRPALKSLIDSELTIHRREITEITDHKIIVKDEEKVIKARAAKEDFVPNFVNPFRNPEQDFAPADNRTPADKDTE